MNKCAGMPRAALSAMLVTVVLTGCAARQAVAPDLRIAREVPTGAAIAWLRQAVSITAADGGSGRICVIDNRGIRPRNDSAIAPFSAYRSQPYGGSGGLIATNLGYALYITENIDAVAGWVVVTRKDPGILGSGDECYIYKREFQGPAAANQLSTVKHEVERTLSALASLGVEVVANKN